jgi:MFS transporter, PPP family, 3-phenylpropionic acid transporter
MLSQTKDYMICSTPRSGSMLLCQLASATGQLGNAVVIPAIIAAYIALLIVVWKLPAGGDREAHEARAPIRKVMAHPAFAWLLGSAALCQATHGVFYSFGTLNWLDHNVPPSLVGILWAGGIVSEITVFSVITRLPDFVRPSKLILIGCIAACARWGILGARSDIFFAIVVQGLQGLSLGATQSGVAQFISRTLPEGIASSATGLYATVAVGLMQTGLVLVSGMWFETIGSGIFLFAAAFAAIGCICAFKLAKYDISDRTRAVPRIAA